MKTGPNLVNTRFSRHRAGLAELMLLIQNGSCSELARTRERTDADTKMAELTNLTDRIAHLRDRKGSSPVVQGGRAPEEPNTPNQKRDKKRTLPERKFATDYFMLFVYALLAVALVAQLALIVWLDVV